MRVASNESLRLQYAHCRRPELQESYSMPRRRDTMDGASDSIMRVGSGASPILSPSSPSLLRFSEVLRSEVPTPEKAAQSPSNGISGAVIAAPDVATSTDTGTATSSTVISGRQGTVTDKPLPSKPVEHGSDEPECRSIIDATDANMKSVTFASLTPNSIRDVPSRSTGRRSITPSNGLGNGSPAPRKVTRKSSRSDLRGSRAPSQQGQRRVSNLPSTSETSEDISGNSSDFKRQSIGAVTIDREGTGVHKTVERAASFISSGAPSPGLEPDDKVRRLTRYGVGVTMKVSLEANKAIYGQSPRAVGQTSTNAASTGNEESIQQEFIRLNSPESDETPRLTRKPNVGKRTPRQLDTSQFPPRISSLVTSPTEDVKQTHKRGHSFASRLARPTAASAAREIEAKRKVSEAKAAQLLGLNEKSGTLTSVKRAGAGFRSRFNSFLPGRLRSDSNQSTDKKLHGYDSILHEKLSTGHLSTVQESRPSSRNHPTHNGTPTELTRVRTNKRFSLESIGKEEEPKAHRQPNPTEASHATEDAQREETASPLNNFVRFHSYHKSLDTSAQPHSSGGSTPRYEEAHDGDDHIDGLVRDAEGHLRRILELAQGIQDPGMRSHVSAIAEALGEAIQATRELRIASIAAEATNTNLALVTKSLSAAAATAIANVGAN